MALSKAISTWQPFVLLRDDVADDQAHLVAESLPWGRASEPKLRASRFRPAADCGTFVSVVQHLLELACLPEDIATTLDTGTWRRSLCDYTRRFKAKVKLVLDEGSRIRVAEFCPFNASTGKQARLLPSDP